MKHLLFLAIVFCFYGQSDVLGQILLLKTDSTAYVESPLKARSVSPKDLWKCLSSGQFVDTIYDMSIWNDKGAKSGVRFHSKAFVKEETLESPVVGGKRLQSRTNTNRLLDFQISIFIDNGRLSVWLDDLKYQHDVLEHFPDGPKLIGAWYRNLNPMMRMHYEKYGSLSEKEISIRKPKLIKDMDEALTDYVLSLDSFLLECLNGQIEK